MPSGGGGAGTNLHGRLVPPSVAVPCAASCVQSWLCNLLPWLVLRFSARGAGTEICRSAADGRPATLARRSWTAFSSDRRCRWYAVAAEPQGDRQSCGGGHGRQCSGECGWRGVLWRGIFIHEFPDDVVRGTLWPL